MDSKFIDMIEELVNDDSLEIEELQSEIQSILDKARIYQPEANDPTKVSFELYGNIFEFLNPKAVYIKQLDVTREVFYNEDVINLELHAPIGSYRIKHKGTNGQNNGIYTMEDQI